MAFPVDYVTARHGFREAADRLGWERQAYSIGGTGPNGEDLTIDVAVSPRAAADRMLVVSSGLHGVEGALGSAIQLELMERWRDAARLPPTVRCVLIHALNPYGFAWSRRCDGDNIDLNRNFLLDGTPYAGASGSYAQCDQWLNPRSAPIGWDAFRLRLLLAASRHGLPVLKQALVTGQYGFPQGLFFGGHGPSRTHELVGRHIKSWIGDASMVAHVDVHTGLGRWATHTLLIDHQLTTARRERLIRWFGAGSFEEGNPAGVAYEARGSLGRWCVGQDLAPDYTFAFAEFGTYGNLSVIAGLRAENRAHHWGSPDDPSTRLAKARLRELFCPRSDAWRSRVLGDGVALVERTLRGLAAEAIRGVS